LPVLLERCVAWRRRRRGPVTALTAPTPGTWRSRLTSTWTGPATAVFTTGLAAPATSTCAAAAFYQITTRLAETSVLDLKMKSMITDLDPEIDHQECWIRNRIPPLNY